MRLQVFHLSPPAPAVVLVLGILALPCAAGADRLALTNGRVVTGVIETEANDRVAIRTSEGLVSFSKGQISKIERESKGENLRAAFRMALARGDISAALGMLNSGEAGVYSTAEIDAAILESSETLVSASASATDGDSARLSSFIHDRPSTASEELLILLSRHYAGRGNTVRALEELRALPTSSIASVPAWREFAVGMLSSEIRRALDAGETDEGIEALRILSEIAPAANGTQSAALLFLRNSSRKASQGDYAGALETLGAQLATVAPATAFNEAQRIVALAEGRLSTTATLELYDQLNAYFGNSRSGQAQLLLAYQRQAKLLLKAGRFDDAERVADKVAAVDADGGALLAHKIEFAKRNAAIPPGDLVAEYKLGVWAKGMGLRDEAMAQFSLAEKSPELRENAQLQSRLMETEMEKAEFQKVTTAFEAGKYSQAMKEAEAFRKKFPKSTLAKQAVTLTEISKFQLTRKAKTRPAEADALYQNAERLYYQNRYKEALNAALRVETDYPDTESGMKAGKMRQAIIRKLRASGTQEALALAVSAETTTQPETQINPHERERQRAEIEALIASFEMEKLR